MIGHRLRLKIWIHLFHNTMDTLSIIKIGGKIINDEQLLDLFIHSFKKIEGPKILVHGGGRAASDLSRRLGIPINMIDGRRVTDKETLEVATMVYAGLVNKKIVAILQRHKCNAIGLSGADANCILSHKREVKEIDYGYVGDIDEINVNTFVDFVDSGLTPVVSPLTHDGNGQLLNTNADTIAATIATALSKHYEIKLSFCFEYNGVLKDLEDANSMLSSVSKLEADAYIADGTFANGMIPKVNNAFFALENGASEVNICGIHHVHETKAGTSFIL